jgi:hypothetical protein
MEYLSTGLNVANKVVNGSPSKDTSSSEVIKDLAYKLKKWDDHKCYSGNIFSMDYQNKFNLAIIFIIIIMIFYINYLRNQIENSHEIEEPKKIKCTKSNDKIKCKVVKEDIKEVDEDMF